MSKGIDVSKHQGKIDWAQAAKAVDFVMIRAGYGKYTAQEDANFKVNIEGAYKAGIRQIGVYWYSYATSSAEAAQEAAACLSVINLYKDKITLPVFFDQEYEPGIKAASKTVRTMACNTFISQIKRAGYESGLYCSYDWLNNMVDKVDGHKWIAQYASKCQYKGADLWAWQYTSKGKVPGIIGNVDMDTGYFAAGTNVTTKSGWVKTGGKWYYYEDGKTVKSAWREITGSNGKYWYYFGADGAMKTGRQAIAGKQFYLNDSAWSGLPEGALWVTDTSGARK